MRCADHTLELEIRNVLERKNQKVFNKGAKKCLTFCSTHTGGIIQRRESKEMSIDMPTSGGSTVLMLQRLVDLKAFVQDLGSQKSYLNENEWEEGNELAQTLEIPCAATIFLQ